ncbi:MAG: PH domain-containing protein [Cyanosarcina radialis HA8281-LM2]|nr:PH domain-containing protein [Cyanosarcina radialis HA8281-LM2]
MRPADIFIIPFSLIWCGFVIFWEVTVVVSGAPLFFILWGIPFVLVGLYFVFGRFIVDARTRERTFYGLTNERIIIVDGLFSPRIKSLNLRTLSDISLTERGDGSGTITFGPTHPMSNWVLPGWPGAGLYASPSFDTIDRAKEIYNLIRQAQNTAR